MNTSKVESGKKMVLQRLWDFGNSNGTRLFLQMPNFTFNSPFLPAWFFRYPSSYPSLSVHQPFQQFMSACLWRVRPIICKTVDMVKNNSLPPHHCFCPLHTGNTGSCFHFKKTKIKELNIFQFSCSRRFSKWGNKLPMSHGWEPKRKTTACF